MGASYYVFSVEFDAKSAPVKWIACAHVPSVICNKKETIRGLRIWADVTRKVYLNMSASY
jgi:hypothetical protein